MPYFLMNQFTITPKIWSLSTNLNYILCQLQFLKKTRLLSQAIQLIKTLYLNKFLNTFNYICIIVNNYELVSLQLTLYKYNTILVKSKIKSRKILKFDQSGLSQSRTGISAMLKQYNSHYINSPCINSLQTSVSTQIGTYKY